MGQPLSVGLLFFDWHMNVFSNFVFSLAFVEPNYQNVCIDNEINLGLG